MSRKPSRGPNPKERQAFLAALREAKMARSVHCYVRGNAVKFYDWLESDTGRRLPHGPPVWICGDCHVGNLGPIASTAGRVDIQVRDLDQTVIGNPAHDLIRLGLSLATAARSSDLPGYDTARLIEAMIDGYRLALIDKRQGKHSPDAKPVRRIMQRALRRRWKNLAEERIENTRPTIPRGDTFWELAADEYTGLAKLLQLPELRRLVTSPKSRTNDAPIHLLDAAYWVKGCSSLGRLRYAVLVGVGNNKRKPKDIAFLDVKEAVAPAAPRAVGANIPHDNAERVVQGALHMSPNLGERMLAAHLGSRAVFVRELMPQDLKLEMDKLTAEEAISAARYLAHVIGHAHARQMDAETKRKWHSMLSTKRTKKLDTQPWLWTSVVELLGEHESAYLEHCRRYAEVAA